MADNNMNGLLVVPEDAGLGFNNVYYVGVHAVSLDSGPDPQGYSSSDLVGFTRISPDLDGDGDVDGADLAKFLLNSGGVELSVIAAHFGRE